MRQLVGHTSSELAHNCLHTYKKFLTYLQGQGQARRHGHPETLPEHAFVQSIPGFTKLISTLASVAPAFPDANDEEWNPLSQRPHAPLTPAIAPNELGHEILALKEAIDAFTTLAHEIMHIALWEPFFVGQWHPRTKSRFVNFSLEAEAFCFFYTDIVISGAIRIRFPDGEFALARQTPSNTLFHPGRAFAAVGLRDTKEILNIYLRSFRGDVDPVLQRLSSSPYLADLSKQTFDFYQGSLPYLDQLYSALGSFGIWDEYYKKYCKIPGLPALFSARDTQASGKSFSKYFNSFWDHGLTELSCLDTNLLIRIRYRRMAQTRAYYALQLRWILQQGLVTGGLLSKKMQRNCLINLNQYLSDIQNLLHTTTQTRCPDFLRQLSQLDRSYEQQVRSELLSRNLWIGQRWMIAPKRANGLIQATLTGQAQPLAESQANPPKAPKRSDKLSEVYKNSQACPKPTSTHAIQIQLLELISYALAELTTQMQQTKTIATRSLYLTQIARISRIAGRCRRSDDSELEVIKFKIKREFSRPPLLALWSLPLASIDPVNNHYRELIFSYQ